MTAKEKLNNEYMAYLVEMHCDTHMCHCARCSLHDLNCSAPFILAAPNLLTVILRDLEVVQ